MIVGLYNATVEAVGAVEVVDAVGGAVGAFVGALDSAVVGVTVGGAVRDGVGSVVGVTVGAAVVIVVVGGMVVSHLVANASFTCWLSKYSVKNSYLSTEPRQYRRPLLDLQFQYPSRPIYTGRR